MNYKQYKSYFKNYNTILAVAWEVADSTKDDRIKLQALELIRNILNSIIECDYRYDNGRDMFDSSLLDRDKEIVTEEKELTNE